MNFDYPLMEPPFQVKPPREMAKAEAQARFEWFLAQSAPRRELLRKACEHTRGEANRVDYTPPSLVYLWNWAQQFFEAVEPPSGQPLPAGTPAWASKTDMDRRELSTGTRCLAVDIGFYIAEVFMRHYPQVKWALWTKKSGPHNQAVLTGFKLPLHPGGLAASCAWSVIRGNLSDRLLLEKYQLWEQDLGKRSIKGQSRISEDFLN